MVTQGVSRRDGDLGALSFFGFAHLPPIFLYPGLGTSSPYMLLEKEGWSTPQPVKHHEGDDG